MLLSKESRVSSQEKDGPFGCGTLSVSNFPSAVFAPITICERRDKQLTAQDTMAKRSITCRRVINKLIHAMLIDFRKSIFLAYHHVSFESWYFSSTLATKLTFTALFGSDSKFFVDQRAFANHAELIYSERGLIALDIICQRERERFKRENLCKRSLQEVGSTIQTEFKNRHAQSVCGFAYEAGSQTFRSFAEIFHLVLAVRQATAEAFFWALFELARSKSIRTAIEEEADACLLLNGELDCSKLYIASYTRNLSLEVLRLAQINNIIVFTLRSRSNLAEYKIRKGDQIIVCPHAFFRSKRYFKNADTLIVGRNYDPSLATLQHLACGGGLAFHIVLLNLALLLLDLAAAFELELVEGPSEFAALPSFQAARPVAGHVSRYPLLLLENLCSSKRQRQRQWSAISSAA